MQYDIIFSALAQLIAGSAKQYSTIRQQCEEQVVRWEFGSGKLYDLEPYYFELHGSIERGQVLGELPQDTASCYGYGLDTQGRVVIEDHNYDVATRAARSVTFFVYREDEVDVFEFNLDFVSPLNGVARGVFSDGRLQSLYTIGPLGHDIQLYEYENGRLHFVSRRSVMEVTKRPPILVGHRFVYDADGLEKIIRTQDGYKSKRGLIVYQSPPRNEKERKAEQMGAIIQCLAIDIGRNLYHIQRELTNDGWYSFLLIPSERGDSLQFAIGSEQSLAAAIKHEAADATLGASDELDALLRDALRWDLWKSHTIYDLGQEGGVAKLRAAYDAGMFSPRGKSAIVICAEALRELNSTHHFGRGVDRERITLGVALRENPQILVKTIRQVNPAKHAERVIGEITSGRAALNALSVGE